MNTQQEKNQLRYFAGSLDELNSMGKGRFRVIDLNGVRGIPPTGNGAITVWATGKRFFGEADSLIVMPKKIMSVEDNALLGVGEKPVVEVGKEAFDIALRSCGADGAIRWNAKIEKDLERQVEIYKEQGIPVRRQFNFWQKTGNWVRETWTFLREEEVNTIDV